MKELCPCLTFLIQTKNSSALNTLITLFKHTQYESFSVSFKEKAINFISRGRRFKTDKCGDLCEYIDFVTSRIYSSFFGLPYKQLYRISGS